MSILNSLYSFYLLWLPFGYIMFLCTSLAFSLFFQTVSQLTVACRPMRMFVSIAMTVGFYGLLPRLFNVMWENLYFCDYVGIIEFNCYSGSSLCLPAFSIWMIKKIMIGAFFANLIFLWSHDYIRVSVVEFSSNYEVFTTVLAVFTSLISSLL